MRENVRHGGGLENRYAVKREVELFERGKRQVQRELALSNVGLTYSFTIGIDRLTRGPQGDDRTY
jgi:hypothetical protein